MRIPLIKRLTDPISDVIDQRSPVLILTPRLGGIGELANDLYFGLLKARRDNKRILFLFPRGRFWRLRFELANSELADIESDCRCLGLNNPWCVGLGWMLGFLFQCLYLSRVFLEKVWAIRRRLWLRRALPELGGNYAYRTPMIGRSTLWRPAGIRHFSWDQVRVDQWREDFGTSLPLRLNSRKYRTAEDIRLKMGIPLDNWFVCLHVREPGFHENEQWTKDIRNASIGNYIEAIRVITGAGGWVVRLGDATMIPLPKMERVIDYAHSSWKSELMDMYLINQCRFYLGSDSGLLSVAMLFNKPTIFANCTQWFHNFSLRQGDLTIIKHLFCPHRDRFLSIQELLEEPLRYDRAHLWFNSDYQYHENTPLEIKDVVEEFMEKRSSHDDGSDLQKIFNQARVDHLRRTIDSKKDALLTTDVTFFYNTAAFLGTQGNLGRKFLEQNWLENSMNKEFACRDPRIPRHGFKKEKIIISAT